MNDMACSPDTDSLGAGDGLLLVGHGTRDAQGQAEFFELAAQIADASGGRHIEPCFLELAEPTIRQAVDRLAARGVHQLVVAPVVLFSAGHARRDIPDAVGTACNRHVGLTWRQAPSLGCHRRIIELSQRRFLSARAQLPPVASWAETLLIMVGRGSHDAEATAEMHRFVQQTGQRFPELRTTVCFCAMAKPLLGETITRIAEDAANRKNPGHFIVQPHLLFQGQLLADIHRQVAEVRSAHPLQHWCVADPLGHEVEVSRAILDLVESTLATGC